MVTWVVLSRTGILRHWINQYEWYYISMRPKSWIECGGSMIGANTLNGKFDKSSAMHRKFCWDVAWNMVVILFANAWGFDSTVEIWAFWKAKVGDCGITKKSSVEGKQDIVYPWVEKENTCILTLHNKKLLQRKFERMCWKKDFLDEYE